MLDREELSYSNGHPIWLATRAQPFPNIQETSLSIFLRLIRAAQSNAIPPKSNSVVINFIFRFFSGPGNNNVLPNSSTAWSEKDYLWCCFIF